jgi:perosamine synthetase
MAIRALGIGDGDEVITTPFSFVASANCLLYERAVPRFVDIEDDSMGLDPELIASASSPQTRAVLPVHVFGRACRIEEIDAIAAARGWLLVEDSCEALGSRVGDRPLGSFGASSVFAFYPNKQITTGEGGVVVTDDPALAAILRSLRNQGRDDDGSWLRHVRLGFNYRLDELSAALGVAQLGRLAELSAGRARVAAAYETALAGYEWIRLPRSGANETTDWFVYVIRLDAAIDRQLVMDQLRVLGIATRPYFSPLHLQPFYRETLGHRQGDFPVTERVAASTLALPFSARLSSADVLTVAQALAEVVEAQFRS